MSWVERLAVGAALLLAACVAPVTLKVGDWTASCRGVPADDCQGVAGLFINNLAWSGAWVLLESGGRLSVEPRPLCPAVPEWADPSFCWQATAKVSTGTVCMVVARQSDPATAGSRFGQVGGDVMTGLGGGPPVVRPTCT
jgi:hypothetical protein